MNLKIEFDCVRVDCNRARKKVFSDLDDLTFAQRNMYKNYRAMIFKICSDILAR